VPSERLSRFLVRTVGLAAVCAAGLAVVVTARVWIGSENSVSAIVLGAAAALALAGLVTSAFSSSRLSRREFAIAFYLSGSALVMVVLAGVLLVADVGTHD
jgi:hypothetical protein